MKLVIDVSKTKETTFVNDDGKTITYFLFMVEGAVAGEDGYLSLREIADLAKIYRKVTSR